MPRATHPGPAALRNRNRVTNKTRLKVIRGDTIEADSIVLDEDEEKARVVSTAGVDAEDANEHHLQAVLTAAASRHQATTRSTRSGDAKDKESAPAAYIPTPDSTGVVQNYDELYPPGRWKDTHSHVRSSDTVEEATSFALANGFIYYMDERDKEWLDKNNEQARGEGMSSQGSVSSSSTRSGRSAKAKGKEPDIVQAVTITEDEFELVMAIFEKVTHEKTEFLHHVSSLPVLELGTRPTPRQAFEQGVPFPPFSDYQDTFAFPLRSDMFAIYSVPEWVPPPQSMLHFARIIYPYWRERRQERGGHRIIPAVNLDESDTKNESYICFRRREIKAIRKTRASQASYSDRMVRLQNELAMALDIVRLVQQREILKRDSHIHGRNLWDKRQTLADLKRAHPSLGSKEDDELFLDKEKPPKKPKVETTRPSLKLRHPPRENGEVGSPVAQPTPVIRPKERCAAIRSAIEAEMQRQKEKDKSWEDAVENPYQSLPVSYDARQFKFPSKEAKPIPRHQLFNEDDENPVKYHVARIRRGRGGRMLLDRRSVNCTLRAANFDKTDVEERERRQRIEERWRYDADDTPPVGPRGMEEQDRKLIDETQPIRLTFTMAHPEDYMTKITIDPTLRLSSGDVKPFQLGPVPNAMLKPPPHPHHQQVVSSVPAASAASSSHSLLGQVNGTPLSVPTQVKLAQMRISSNGGMRMASGSTPNPASHPPSPHATPLPSGATGNPADGQRSPPKPDQDVKMAHGSPSGAPSQLDGVAAPMPSPTPAPSKPLASTGSVNLPNLPNGYHIPAMNGYTTVPKAGFVHPGTRPNGLSIQQIQSLQAMLPADNVNIALRQPGAYVLPNGAYQMPMAAGRPMQWPMAGQHSPPNANVGIDVVASQGAAGSPGRAPPANGMRTPQLSQGRPMPSPQVHNATQGTATPAGPHIARLTPHTPSPHVLSPNLTAAQVNAHSSPTRTPQPAIPNPSPSLQSRQLVGGSGAAGY
ncbi:enhancer of polycomb-like-domain-containing protein [Dichomitus squalens]|uniref:Enhancer of polycomb-like protein n=1 Tax=Dichomitus squalens TaxID=114155 RepID=A0A4V2K9J6_9APHY|nr:enhancer of polycomb-like-domain-containing protein [Dichomitus squalens]TBU64178.1 enhancer of polycomb-like-domain-containing protein [Dichomitus squalens]